jgi:hypothetical protein
LLFRFNAARAIKPSPPRRRHRCSRRPCRGPRAGR